MSKITLPCALHDINGNEIVDFLTQKLKSDESPFEDTMIRGEFVFDSQEIKNQFGTLIYILDGHTFCNNRRRDDELEFTINITEDKIWVWFDEPVEGDGTDRIVVDLLKEWLPTHTFSQNNNERYTELIRDINDDFAILFEPSKEMIPIIDGIIEKLQKAKSYIK